MHVQAKILVKGVCCATWKHVVSLCKLTNYHW
jgi:hypothetical protein